MPVECFSIAAQRWVRASEPWSVIVEIVVSYFGPAGPASLADRPELARALHCSRNWATLNTWGWARSMKQSKEGSLPSAEESWERQDPGRSVRLELDATQAGIERASPWRASMEQANSSIKQSNLCSKLIQQALRRPLLASSANS